MRTSKAKDVAIVAVVKNSCRVTSADVTITTPDSAATFALEKGKSQPDHTGWGVLLTLAPSDLANASPEPVKKGKTITVKGTLERAHWETSRDGTYGKQKVRLQFTPATGAYATVKTVTGSTKGRLSTTVTATRDGCFRYVFAGTSSTAKPISKADCVDVR